MGNVVTLNSAQARFVLEAKEVIVSLLKQINTEHEYLVELTGDVNCNEAGFKEVMFDIKLKLCTLDRNQLVRYEVVDHHTSILMATDGQTIGLLGFDGFRHTDEVQPLTLVKLLTHMYSDAVSAYYLLDKEKNVCPSIL